MARPLRIEFSGALYHVTARGDRRAQIYASDEDRRRFLALLGEVVGDFNWLCYAYCLMDNHYHLVIETPDANLSKGMRQLNGVYTQWANRRHDRVGHLFQGRYRAILVDREPYFLQLARYVVMNPVRAGVVKRPADWPWSSHAAVLGAVPAPDWLAVDGLLAHFAERRSTARSRYARFVEGDDGQGSPWRELRGQVFLGDEAFVTRMLARARKEAQADVQIPRAQRRPPARSLAEFAERSGDRDQAIVAAYASGAYSYQDIAEHFGVHFTTVGRVVRRARGR